VTGSDGTVAAEFGSAPFFALLDVRVSDRSVIAEHIVANAQADNEKGRGLRVAEWLVSQGADIVVAQEDIADKGSGYALRAHGVTTTRTQAATTRDAVATIPLP
jgi:predicted Fe-Mo cluster-binding NifX family protein